MADDPQSESPVPERPPSGQGAPPPRESRRKPLTPELRKFLGTPRIKEEEPEAEVEEGFEAAQEEHPATQPLGDDKPTQAAPAASAPHMESTAPEARRPAGEISLLERPPEEEEEERKRRRSRRQSAPSSPPAAALDRRAEVGPAMRLVGAVVVLALAFYVGRNYDSWRNRLQAGHQEPKLKAQTENLFAGLSADDLVVQALEAERAGNVQEALDRFTAAKHKNQNYRGILLHAGRLCYENGRFEEADRLFASTIAFGEDLGAANHYRGLMAVRRKDFPAAQRFFATAAEAEPFAPEHLSQLAEAFRLAQQPTAAYPHYRRAALLARNEQDRALYEFKLRLARLESPDAPKMVAELTERQQAGTMSIDWLMTAAALHIRQGQPGAAIPLIERARGAGEQGLFAACAGDVFFAQAAEKHPQLAEALRSQ